MNLFQLFRNIRPFVRPYRLLVALTLVLTLVGSAMQQVNAIVLDRTRSTRKAASTKTLSTPLPEASI